MQKHGATQFCFYGYATKSRQKNQNEIGSTKMDYPIEDSIRHKIRLKNLSKNPQNQRFWGQNRNHANTHEINYFFFTTFFAGAFLAAGFFATTFLATGFLTAAFFAGAFLATGFLTATFFAGAFLATGFFATGFLTATFFAGAFLATGFFAAGFLTATFFAGAFLAAGFAAGLADAHFFLEPKNIFLSF